MLTSKDDLPAALLCTQNNVRRSYLAQEQLIINSQSEGRAILFITEPVFTKSVKLYGVPRGFSSFAAGKDSRAAIATKDVNAYICPQYTSRDCVTCQVNHEGNLTYIVALYLDCFISDIPQVFLKLLSELGGKSILVTSDCNSHSILWGSEKTDSRGEMVDILILQNNMVILNYGNKPTF